MVPQKELRYSGELLLLTSLKVLTHCWSSHVGGESKGKGRFPSYLEVYWGLRF